jgi:hypothetical protein
MSIETIKLGIIKKILALERMEVLMEIQSLIDKTLKDMPTSPEPDSLPNKMSFEEWSLQFEDEEGADLDEFLPEHGMTLIQLRRAIWEGEQSKEMTYSEFFADQQAWRK